MTLKHLTIIGGYPSIGKPTRAPFVKQIAHAIARKGICCTVISPLAFQKGINRKGSPYRSIEHTNEGNTVEILRPLFFSMSARESFARLGKLNPGLFTLWSYTRAVQKILNQLNNRPDALYGHFLYMAGAAAVRAGKELNIPAFPCVGEGEFWTVRSYGKARAKMDMEHASGFLANSSLLKKKMHYELDVNPEKIAVFPNGTNKKLFYPRGKNKMRKKLGLPHNLFLTAYAGNFSYKKGAFRVAKAIDGLEGVGGIFMGKGPLPPKASNIFINKQVPPEDVPELLSAADVFVLPTLVEGSCNAIVEAMACGLPIISSQDAFNDDLLTEDMSIRVAPLNVNAIRESICTLRDDSTLRIKMAEAALERSRKFDINDRVRGILDFMESRIQQEKVRGKGLKKARTETGGK